MTRHVILVTIDRVEPIGSLQFNVAEYVGFLLREMGPNYKLVNVSGVRVPSEQTNLVELSAYRDRLTGAGRRG